MVHRGLGIGLLDETSADVPGVGLIMASISLRNEKMLMQIERKTENIGQREKNVRKEGKPKI